MAANYGGAPEVRQTISRHVPAIPQHNSENTEFSGVARAVEAKQNPSLERTVWKATEERMDVDTRLAGG